MSAQVVAIIGAAGSGKTWLGERLSARLICPRLAIDDFGTPGSDRWAKLLTAVDGIDGPVVVESCAVPILYRRLATITVLLQVPHPVRRQRLLDRGESPDEATRMARDDQHVPTHGDIEVSESIDLDALADQIRGRLAAEGAL